MRRFIAWLRARHILHTMVPTATLHGYDWERCCAVCGRFEHRVEPDSGYNDADYWAKGRHPTHPGREDALHEATH